ncbi:MAG TPA: bifunctional serine/threonine-protein kinase/ABC transporter substrate-binding protein, partial [Gemmata sp.]|nr:bifunctional serine/threonine-protein kinase/ABC transporter substrate-binding protein [Gemmata sp.]
MSELESGNQTKAGTSALEKTLQSNAPSKAYPFLKPPIEADEIGRLGNYRVLRLIGTGGMGFVFEAEEISLHRRVALKVLRHDLGNEFENRERFLREARAAAAINSDHVVTVYQIVEGDPPYLVMQFLTGESLQSRIEEPDSITLHAALVVARQTADGLAAAHAIGLIHRDIKPANIWLEKPQITGTETSDTTDLHKPPSTTAQLGRVKILDFGLARRLSGEPSLTSTGFIVGTPNYMSPEQASGIEVDPRSDIFSLGCVLYTMLTGELPFPGSSAMAVMMALANKIPASANVLNPSIPKKIAAFTDRLLEKEPNKRPQTAREVVAELDRLLVEFTGNTSLMLPLPTSKKTPVATPAAIETVLTDQNKSPAAGVPIEERSEIAVRKSAQNRSPLLWITFSLTIAIIGFLIFLAIRNRDTASVKDAGALQNTSPEPIPVGILHSRDGRLASIEKPIIDSTLLALEELSKNGGVLGRPLKIISEDGKSDPDEYARAAEKLLTVDKAVVIFGCWTGTSRRTVRPVIERNNGLLFFPAPTEGLEQSPRIVYL